MNEISKHYSTDDSEAFVTIMFKQKYVLENYFQKEVVSVISINVNLQKMHWF